MLAQASLRISRLDREARSEVTTSFMITLDLPSPRSRSAPGKPPSQPLAARLPALRGFLQRARLAASITGEVSILLSTDRTLRRLNREFRGMDKPTDVLSFPAAEVPKLKNTQPISGDLAISLDTAARQARSFGHTLETELRVLILHGLLHLAGFDHEMDHGEMAAREEELRRRFRLPTALIARVSIPRSALKSATKPASKPASRSSRGRA